jgi:phage shock protein A
MKSAPHPDMTAEQARELKTLRKQEAQQLKAISKEERRLRRELDKLDTWLANFRRRQENELRKALKTVHCEHAKRAKPLRAQLHKLSAGRVPQASALAAIRKRIAILEGRLES